MSIPAYRRLLKALLICMVVRVVGLLTMATLLGPALDFNSPVTERAAYVAAHSWLWRLGWLPWQLTAVWDVGLSLALFLYLRQVSGRGWAIASLLASVAAFFPDQWAQYVCVTSFVGFAENVVAGQVSPQQYVALESRLLLYMGTFGCAGYTVMAWCWMRATAAFAPARSPWLLRLGRICWFLFTLCAAANWYSTTRATPTGYPLSELLFVLNALAFPLLSVWMVMMGSVIGEGHHHRFPAHDRELQELKWPGSQSLTRILTPGLRDLIRCVPERLRFCVLASDITDVVYLNWMVPVERVAPLLPEPLELEVREGMTCISILTYRHGRFGPRFLGGWRRFFPSPLQSNWRFYLKNEREEPAIYFLKAVQSNGLVVGAARLLCDGLPSHLSAAFRHERVDGDLVTSIVSGTGSAPDLYARVSPSGQSELPLEWGTLFGSVEEATQYLVEQSKAVRTLPHLGKVCDCYIDIPIDPTKVIPARVVEMKSEFLRPLVGDAEPFAFVVPRVAFQALGERLYTV